MILYKYRSDNEFTERIFTDKKVWLSTAAGLNDPFECKITEIAKDWIDERVSEGRQAHIAGFVIGAKRSIDSGTDFFGHSPKETNELLSRLRNMPSFEALYEYFREFIRSAIGSYPSDPVATFNNFDTQLEKVGIFSLSTNPANQLLWAHYGNESRGLALGFNATPGSKLADPEHCLPVAYSDTLPAFSGAGLIAKVTISLTPNGPVSRQQIAFSDPTFKAAISTKATCWSYEDEWRYIEEQAGSYDYPGPLTEVVFGLKCPVQTREKYQTISKSVFGDTVRFREVVNLINSNQIQVIDCS